MTVETTKDLIAEARELAEKATPGPWKESLCEWECDCFPIPDECSSEPDTCGNGRILTGAYVPETKTTEWGDYCDMNDADATFIARSRTLVPELCDALEKALADVERLKTACRSCPGLSLMAAHGYGEIKHLPEPPERKGD